MEAGSAAALAACGCRRHGADAATAWRVWAERDRARSPSRAEAGLPRRRRFGPRPRARMLQWMRRQEISAIVSYATSLPPHDSCYRFVTTAAAQPTRHITLASMV